MPFKKNPLLFCLFLLPFNIQAQLPTTDSLAREYVHCLKTNDKARFLKMFPTRNTMFELMQELVKAKNMELQDSAKVDLVLDRMNMVFAEDFDEAVARLNQLVPNPENLQYVSSAIADSGEEPPVASQHNYKGKIWVADGSKKYRITIIDILHYKGSFYGADFDGMQLEPQPKKTTKPAAPAKKTG